MTTRPAITQATAGFPASDAWWLSQVFNPLLYLFNYAAQVLSYTAITANTSTTTTTETIGITTPSITFQNGRAYRITFKGLAGGSITTGDQGRFRVRKTDASGITLIDSFNVSLVNGNSAFVYENMITNTSGADINAVLVATYVRVTGTSTVSIAASTTNVAYIMVEDMGLASSFTNATALT